MKRAYVVNQADLRMDGNLAMNVKRVLPVTQADVATAAQQGIFWNVKRYEVVNTLDNLRGGTQRILKVNAAAPGVQRAFLTSATTIVTVLGVPPLVLPDAVEGDLVSLKAFGGTEQGLPSEYQLYTEVEAGGVTYTYSSQNLTQIPCMRIADNVFGLYNLITQTFISEV